MENLYNEMLQKNLISIKRIPRNEKLVSLLRITRKHKTIHLFSDNFNANLAGFINHLENYNDVVIMSLN